MIQRRDAGDHVPDILNNEGLASSQFHLDRTISRHALGQAHYVLKPLICYRDRRVYVMSRRRAVQTPEQTRM
jgi:hypothetical protein